MSTWSALPEGWVKRFFHLADLSRSFRELDGCPHFFAETMRGRIRSLQLRFQEAKTHFHRARRLAVQAEASGGDLGGGLKNVELDLQRQLVLELYCFENDLLRRPVDPETEEAPPSQISVPASCLQRYPDFKRAADQKKLCEAIFLLHLGRCDEALGCFEELVRDSSEFRAHQLAVYYLGLVACHENLGHPSRASDNLENAALANAMIEESLNAALVSSMLIGVHHFRGEARAAADWQTYLRTHVVCPQETKEIFFRRSQLLWRRCLEHSRLVIF